MLVTPYDSITQVAADALPWMPVRGLICDPYESYRYASRVTAPTLLLQAERDTVIPPERTLALLSHFRPGLATHGMLAGSDHNSISDHPDFWRLVRGGRNADAGSGRKSSSGIQANPQ